MAIDRERSCCYDITMKIVTAQEMRSLEQASVAAGTPLDDLMENAGRAVATEVARLLGTGRHNVLVLTGPGNNGGDGLVAARCLYDAGEQVSVYLCGSRPADDAKLALVKKRGINCLKAEDDKGLEKLARLAASANVVIDAVFGTGNNRPLGGVFEQVLKTVAKVKGRRPEMDILAIDLPSGLNADTGVADDACLFTDYTVTLGLPKIGLYSPIGVEMAGKVIVADIGLSPHLDETIKTELITSGWVKSVLPRRPLSANKGTFGKVMVAAGSVNYVGAAYLACEGAVRSGAGLVTLAMPSSLQAVIAAKLTEVTYLPLPEAQWGIYAEEGADALLKGLAGYNVLLVGCGLGQAATSAAFVRRLVTTGQTSLPLVLDADALNALSDIDNWWQALPDDVILTPHPGEMSRLSGQAVADIQQDRVGFACQMAQKWGKTVVLKGANTVIAVPDGRCRVCGMANAGLASAGTGDVLAGVIAGLLAQGLNLFAAASAGVYLHALAGEMVRQKLGDSGMTASDLLPVLPLATKKTKEEG